MFVKKISRIIKDDAEIKFHVDLITDGTVPKQFHISTQRSMPVVKVFGSFGYIMFSSKQSYDRFKVSPKTEFNDYDYDGVGIPLLQIVRDEDLRLPFSSKEASVFKIYKFEIKSVKEPPPYDKKAVLIENNGRFKLYKVPFCQIYKKSSFTNVEYVFRFMNGPIGKTKYGTIHRREFRDLYTKLDDKINFRWHIDYNPIMTNDHYILELLDEIEVSLLDSDIVKREKKKLENSHKCHNHIMGHYTKQTGDLFPGILCKEGELIMGELLENVGKYGITDVPWLTQVFACQSLLLHYLDHDKEKEKKGKSRNRHRSLFSSIQ
ncbi:uncharacterized protein NDAI_0C06340 [Naumovozyma dairenensis CBS 421]|uniref:Uncharacterized protein n=1 Tax=Naumovozyma dairenensis (strain ATCC 10597 / BCRC 20456 / CBS 421 / NBRC 0211 / NRRL Y-12639) TaxID=1071378 RepID=G0W932_NAUDC|nr:hypothetical protein NDAI_0C06340 [Naumovozyma dairenensis CBS 421]CCD24293.1 hypothetical protein NDAI_0C06340 [Naumovozyma dairenensis CBS 421]